MTGAYSISAQRPALNFPRYQIQPTARPAPYPMPPKTRRGRSKPYSRSLSVRASIVVFDTSLISYHQSEGEGYSGDSGGLTTNARTPYRWQDLLNSELHPTDFDVALTNVLRSAAEMEKIQGLNEQEFQGVVDILGRVRIVSTSPPSADALSFSTWEPGMS